jgi:hypothetical protein
MRNVLLLLTLLPLSSPAACTDQTWNPGWSWTYDGTVGPYRVRFELMQTNGHVTGYYFYTSQLKDIRLTGTIADEQQIRLQELGPDGKPEAEIRGEFPDQDPQGKLKGNLACDIITGTWQKADGSNKLPVFLRTRGSLPDPHGHRYQVAGANDDETINRAAERFQKAVLDGDKAIVASMIRYPVTVSINRKKTKIRNREQMIADYDAIFTPGYRKAIENAIPRDMFARYDGIMLGDHGEVWFDENGRVAGLNNVLTQ